MKNTFLIAALASVVSLFSCSEKKSINVTIDESLAFSAKQYTLMAEVMKGKPDLLPKSINKEGKLATDSSRNWVSGFFPGSLWYLYEGTKDAKFLEYARLINARVEREKFTTNNHDVGFILYCSFGNGLRLTGEKNYNEILLTGAKSLATRFNPKIGCIKSWERPDKWQYPVIIDNMMNLELMFWATKYSGDSTFYKMAVSHADNTIKNHYRPDFSCYHVVSYDTITGKVEKRQTAQGYSDESAWARGQTWGLYGFTMAYRETKDKKYLDHAVKIAKYLISQPNLPADKIPYWDFNAPGIPNEQRDASSGAIMASALIELSQYVDPEFSKTCLATAEAQIRSLSSPAYRAKLGENGDFILMHSVTSKPKNVDIDNPLAYADYYYLEAMLRYKALMSKQKNY
ncbi:MAG: glycoside hydrolase family 88 protein [Prolixibacteraceae bacterium]